MTSPVGSVEAVLLELQVADRHAAAWCAAQCARSVLSLVPAKDERPLAAIEAAEAWAIGKGSSARCLEAALGAMAAMATSSDPVAADAAEAAAYAANVAGDGEDMKDAPAAAAYAAYALAQHIVVSHSGSAPWRAALERARDRLWERVRVQRWPRTEPSAEQLRAASVALRAQWEGLAAVGGSFTVEDLLSAYRYAQREGMQWRDPLHRAIAERAFAS